MHRYNPLAPPDPDEWLALDESERIELIAEHHLRTKEKLPNLTLHAGMHAAVETQSAMGDKTPVRRTLERLRREGLDRHDAVHAVGSVLAAHLFELLKDDRPKEVAAADYAQAVDRLTAESWRRSFEDP